MKNSSRLRSVRSTLGSTKKHVVVLFKLISGEDIIGLIEPVSTMDTIVIRYPAKLMSGLDMNSGSTVMRLDSLFLSDDVGYELKKSYFINASPVTPAPEVVKNYWIWLRSTYQERALAKFDAGCKELIQAHRYHPEASTAIH